VFLLPQRRLEYLLEAYWPKDMIGHFPTPCVDELLYSICARFSGRVAYPNAKSVLKELFGATTATAVIDLPNRLGHLASSLPLGTCLTVNRLIEEHTFFPYFSAFLPPERVKQIRKDMQISSGPTIHMRSGAMGSAISMPDRLRFCPACRQEDEEESREIYWHRLHQLPGVEVCPQHQVLLENGDAGIRANRKHLLFISAEQATSEVPACRINAWYQDHQVLLKIARDAAWLLGHLSSGTSLKSLHSRYLNLLIERELATYTYSIHVKKLLKKFNSYYSPDLLKLLHCELRGSDTEKSNWLLRLARGSKHAMHPLYHLLLMQFLGCTAEEFFQLPEDLNFFGKGPWPCLNPAANHFKEPVIQEYTLSPRLRDNHPIARFNCECGFAYSRSGPDSPPDDRFRIGKMISFGSVWEAELKGLWKESSLSLSEIGRRLRVDPLTVRRHATRLKLPFSCSGKRSKPLKRTTRLKSGILPAAWEKKLGTCRSKWLSTIRQTPKITMKILRRKLSQEYAWLLQNDSNWLKKHSPQAQKHVRSTSSVDWKERDVEYAVTVRDAASRLMSASHRPIQITKTSIGRAIGATTLLQQKLDKMPLTAQVLASLVETREKYAVRRVWWAADFYCQAYVLPREWQLVMRANVYSLKEDSAVKCAVEEAMNMVRSRLSQIQMVRAPHRERRCHNAADQTQPLFSQGIF
jgi:hypothetical protein